MDGALGQAGRGRRQAVAARGRRRRVVRKLIRFVAAGAARVRLLGGVQQLRDFVRQVIHRLLRRRARQVERHALAYLQVLRQQVLRAPGGRSAGRDRALGTADCVRWPHAQPAHSYLMRERRHAVRAQEGVLTRERS